jgi:hypothetical protein
MDPTQSNDVLARHRRIDGLYEIRQRTPKGDVYLEGPYSRVAAETRLRALANEHGTDAWIQQIDGRYRFLDPVT